MSEYTIELDQRQWRAAVERLGPERAAQRARAAMLESLAFLQNEVRQAMPVDTGLGRGSVVTELRGRTLGDLSGEVGSPLAHVAVLEYGRKPGGPMPPVAPIEAWAQRHGMAGLGYVIARAIARRGLKARHMFRNAAQKGQAVIPSIFRRHLGGL